MSDINENEIVEEVEEVEEPQEEIFVKPPKRKRAPMSEERKEVLREQLKKAREAKKSAKEEVKEEPKVVSTSTTPGKGGRKKVVNAYEAEQNSALKKELALLKKQKADEIKMKLEKKELAAAKRLATKQKKELEKKLTENIVAKPAVRPPPPPPPPVEVRVEAPVVPRYSTYKKSIWTDFM